MLKNIKTLIRYYSLIRKRYLYLMIFGSFISSITILLVYFYPILLKNIIDISVNKKMFPLTQFYYISALFITIIILKIIGQNIFIKNMINSQMDIRAKLFEQSFTLNYKEIKKFGTTYYARLINEDVGGTFQPFTTNFIDSLFAIVRIFPIMITIFLWDYYLFSMFFTVLLFYFLYNYLQNKMTVPLSEAL